MNVNSNRYIHLRKIWQLVVVVLFATQSFQLFAEDSAGRFSQGLIWKVEKEGVAPSYLLGTMHVADSRVTNFSSTLNQIIKRCRSLTLEVKLDANAQLEMSQAMIVKDGKVLNQHLTLKELERIKARFVGQPAMMSMINLLKPWAVTLLLSMPKSSPGLPMDAVLQERFLALNKPVYQLESPMEQIDIFEQLSVPVQVAMLKETIAKIEEIDLVLKATMEKYLAEDIGGLLELNNELLVDSKVDEMPEFFKDIIDRRNLKMLKRMQQRLMEGNALIAIGALHLPGEQGLLSLLDALGYQVTNVVQL